jgi:hypothetical protein
MSTNRISYNARNFADVRTELINFVKQYYPEIFNDFNDASVGMMLLELNAAVGDMLSFHTDRMFQETQLDFAQERSSILSLARTYGLKVPGKRASACIVDFTCVVPTLGNTFDISYAPLIRSGAQVTGAGKVFETKNDIDFSSPFTIGGTPNRIVTPNIDNNGNILSYTLTKREMVINGVTKYYKRVLNTNDVRPFFEIVLPETDVLSITSVITLDGTNLNGLPSLNQFSDENLEWYEVDALADDTIFIPDNATISDNASIKPGKYKRIVKKFITEYTDNGFIKLIFGGGSQDVSSLSEFGVDPALISRIGDFINNSALGVTVTANQTMFVKYRVGGGSSTNVGPNVLTSIGIADININGSSSPMNTSVRASIRVNNPIPAIGGRDEPSIEELRNLVRHNFSAQNRAVTINDYKTRISLMPGDFGSPFRCGIFEEQNKIKIFTVNLDSEGKLSNQSSTTLQQNIATYLSDYRMINDYIEISNARIINLAFEIDLVIDKQFTQSQIISETINTVKSYLDINNWNIGDDIYLGQLLEKISNISGVINVVDIRVFNKVGNPYYSINEISQPYINDETRQIDLLGEYRLFGEPNAMFEIKKPEFDIICRVK